MTRYILGKRTISQMGKSFSDLKYLQVLDHRRLMHTIDNNNCIYYDIYSLNFFEFLLGARYYAK